MPAVATINGRKETHAERIERIHGMTPEEYQHYRHTMARAGEESSLWGVRRAQTAQESHERTWDRYPRIQQFRVPRYVAERLDINANAKLIYGVLLAFGGRATVYIHSIAGLTGLSTYSAGKGLHDLRKAGLLTIIPHWRQDSHHFRAASTYIVIYPPNRFKNKKTLTPRYLGGNISNLQEVLNARFDGFES